MAGHRQGDQGRRARIAGSDGRARRRRRDGRPGGAGGVTDERYPAVVAAALRHVAPDADPGALDPDVDVRDQIDFDSMDFLNLVSALQDATGLEIPERDYPHLATTGGCVRYLREHAAGPPDRSP